LQQNQDCTGNRMWRNCVCLWSTRYHIGKSVQGSFHQIPDAVAAAYRYKS